jgi:probable HAF family extracellular repeat protein
MLARIPTLVFLTFLIQAAATGQNFRFHTLDVHGAVSTVPKAINPQGDVVGVTTDPNGNGHGFLYQKGKFYSIDVPRATFTNAVGINARGDIVGRWSDHLGTNHGYVLSQGKFRKFDVPGCSADTTPHGINNAGDIVGRCIDGAGNLHGFLLSGTTATVFDVPQSLGTDAYKSTDEGEIVGFYIGTTEAAGAYVRSPSGHFTHFGFPKGINAGARGINERYDIVGEFDTPADGQTHGFLLKDGQYVPLDVPGSVFTVASDINNVGTIVGDYVDAVGVDHGFIAKPAK